ncbi:MAG: glycosyltransferase family 2 protein [Glaciecola sp.]|jgi:glycosyltransferase involved in cell wall biosynthesis
MKLNISVFIITKNEAQHLNKTLESVKDMDEVIVVDSGSTDDTLAIAERHGATIYEKAWSGYAKQKQYALSLCKHDWVLNLDGDEVINAALQNALVKVMKKNKVSSVRFKRNDYFINKLPSALTKKPNNLRFYKRIEASFDSDTLVHETAKVIGKELFINESFTHYGYNDIHALNGKINDYSSLKAQEKFEKGKRSNLVKLILVFPVTFIKKYLLQRWVFSGRRGFIKATMDANYAFLKEAKLYECEQLSQEKLHNDKK